MRTYALDISKYQHPFDTQKILAVNPPPALIAHRASIGSLYQDPFFLAFGTSFAIPGILFTAYHVIRPDYGAKDQAQNFLNTLSGAKLSFPVVLDCELDCGRPPVSVAACILSVIKYIEDALDYTPILYSRKNWLEKYFNTPAASDLFYWIACYPQPENPQVWQNYTQLPGMPEFLEEDDLVLHQITDRADGLCYGAASKQIDLSYWCRQQSPEAFVAAYYPCLNETARCTPLTRIPCLDALAQACGCLK